MIYTMKKNKIFLHVIYKYILHAQNVLTIFVLLKQVNAHSVEKHYKYYLEHEK